MHTDLFLALRDPENPRGHPILAAWLYAYCPAAARWWLNGAEPIQVFDPLWFALTERAAGKTLAEVLRALGFETLLPDVKQYLEQVEAYRRHHPHLPAPELLPTFSGGRLDAAKQFNHHAAIAKLGGAWPNYFAFIHAWAFVYRDWATHLKLPENAVFSAPRLALTVEGVRKPAFVPAWAWEVALQEAPKTKRIILGCLEPEPHDQIKLALFHQAGLAGEKPWPQWPEIHELHPNGQTTPADLRLPDGMLPALVARLADCAKNGPHPPLPALQKAEKCRGCGFRAQCFTPKGELSALALGF